MRLDRSGREYIDALVGEPEQARRGRGRDRALRCLQCGRVITHESERIEVRGAHAHRFRNPAGLVFHIGCFGHAPGCAAHGSATEQHTWFPGCSWQVAICSGCHGHLGWWFRDRAGGAFHGLILARLAADGDS